MMPSASTPSTELRKIYQALFSSYGPREWWPARTPFEVIIGAYLVQNTSWRGVVRSITNLEIKGALTAAGIRALPLDELRTLIRPSGYMTRKAAALKAFVDFLDQQHAGSLDRLASQSPTITRSQLLTLAGVGPETADAILLYALGHPVIVVDEYFRRIAHRHGLIKQNARYADLQTLAIDSFAHDHPDSLLQHYNEFHALMVEAGKNHCGPTPRCTNCPLEHLHRLEQPMPSPDTRTNTSKITVAS